MNHMFRMVVGCGALALALAPGACRVTNDGGGGGSSSGEGSMGEDSPDLTHEADNAALAACGDPVCPAGFAQRIEEGYPFSLDATCLLEGMRNRTPGLYRITLDWTWSNGSESSDFTLFVTSGGAVEVGARRLPDPYASCCAQGTWDATRRCTLRPSDFFADCLAMIDLVQTGYGNEDGAMNCVYPLDDQNLPWFESCAVQPSTCE